MKLKNDDYFSKLYISPNSIVSKDIVDEKIKIIRQQAKKKEDQIYDETSRKKSAIYKYEHLDKLEEWESKMEKAYEYCSSPKNILLRNIIVDLNRQTQGINLEIKNLNEPQSSIVIRKTQRDGECIDSDDLRLLEIEKYDLIDGIKKLKNSLKRYKMKLSLNWERLECDFYAEGLDIRKIQEDKRYLQAILQAIETQNMQSFRDDEHIYSHYIGKVEFDETTENYVVLINEKIKQSIQLIKKQPNEKNGNIKSETTELEGNNQKLEDENTER